MADDAVTFLLNNVSQLLISYGDLISGAEDELHLLKNDLDLLKSFLQDAANEPKKEEPFREMERQIKEVVYDAEDTIDSYFTQAAPAKSRNLSRRHFRTKPVSLSEVVRSLREDELKPMFHKIKLDFANMEIGDGSDTTLEQEEEEEDKGPSISRESALGVEEGVVVGFRDQEYEIVKRVIEPTKELGFISIIGVPGQGKTTLARKIYQNQRIQYEFPTRIWVYVSQDLNRKDVFLNILKEVTSKDMSSMSDDELSITVCDFLEKRRFLLVLDDVWTIDSLIAIQDVLPTGNRMSRVLITTRFDEVGSYAGGPHKLRFLFTGESWELLNLRVFGQPNGCPPQLIRVGKSIARLCDGLPLAILMVGGILVDLRSRKQSMSELKIKWEQLSREMFKIFLNADGLKRVEDIVALNYVKLPDELRNCFLYLGMFPEDYEIPASTLKRLWIAEGFIRHKEGQSLEEMAEENLKRLIGRNFLIVDKVRPDGKVKTCRVHDMVRDFCILESGGNVNLFQEITKSDEGTFEPPNSELKQHRRLCIHSDVLDFFSSEPYVPSVRSFLCFSKTESLLLPEHTSKIPGAFELLRVLDIKPIRFTRFPLELTQLFLLRYIALSSDFKVLPEAISSLRNTQTLIIHTSSPTLDIKADIWKMIQLRHVKTNASIRLHKKPENNGGQELQTLAYLSPENCTNDVFAQARHLRKLGIRGRLSILVDGEVESRKLDNFEKLNGLENLKLINDVHISSPSESRLRCLPPPEKFPPKLKSLTLSATFLDWEHMSVLGMLENLEVLKLKDNAFVGQRWEAADGSFRALQVLQIGYTNLEFWIASGHHFPKLRCLMLRNCEKLEALPDGLAAVPSLQVIELLRPSKSAAASARKIKQERLQMEGNPRIKLSIYLPDE